MNGLLKNILTLVVLLTVVAAAAYFGIRRVFDRPRGITAPDTVYVERFVPRALPGTAPETVELYSPAPDTSSLADTTLTVPSVVVDDPSDTPLAGPLGVVGGEPVHINGHRAILTLWNPGKLRYERRTYRVRPDLLSLDTFTAFVPGVAYTGVYGHYTRPLGRGTLSVSGGPVFNYVTGRFGVGFRVTFRLPILH